ncbi:tetratricopeptide repeat protein [Granulosicoccus sp. 3-233]|uniref:tetratricopeptide repeat protein n=1 Tax=Granulosicoccus sp. 3-233 TaxID=3417969 RepID=UPI003D33D891
MRRFSLLLIGLLLHPATQLLADQDNLLAHRLFQAGEYAQASEIFTDPAWKGVALYRSEQWWRAAEAFIRASDPVSAFNLGNCYVQLGYHELALEAYQHALSMDPSLEDASHNAELMRQLLAKAQDQQQGGRQPSGEEIGRLDTRDDRQERGIGETGEEQSKAGDSAPEGQPEEPGDLSMNERSQARAGQGAQASEQERPSAQDDGSGALDGEASDAQPASRPSGGSEPDSPTSESQAAGRRTELEKEQATTQWLNRIEHDASLYLQRRIRLEQRRRHAAGQSAPEGGSSW